MLDLSIVLVKADVEALDSWEANSVACRSHSFAPTFFSGGNERRLERMSAMLKRLMMMMDCGRGGTRVKEMSRRYRWPWSMSCMSSCTASSGSCDES